MSSPVIDREELAQLDLDAAEDAGLELLDLYDEVNLMVANGDNINPDIEQIMEMLDVNEDGKVTYTECIAAIESLAKLLNFDIGATDKGEIKYMWTLLDSNGDGQLSKDEVEAILEKAPLIEKLNKVASKTLNVGTTA